MTIEMEVGQYLNSPDENLGILEFWKVGNYYSPFKSSDIIVGKPNPLSSHISACHGYFACTGYKCAM
jgi:hypothetical protein